MGKGCIAARFRSGLLYQMYLAGYSGRQSPRWLRLLLAGSCWHRAWLLGRLGFFVENGIGYGPANPYPGCISSENREKVPAQKVPKWSAPGSKACNRVFWLSVTL